MSLLGIYSITTKLFNLPCYDMIQLCSLYYATCDQTEGAEQGRGMWDQGQKGL